MSKRQEKRRSEAQPTASGKYTRPRRPFSPIGVLIGMVLGLSSSLFIAWQLAPIQQVDVDPWQISRGDQAQYMVAIALAYADDSDLNRAVERLLTLRLPGDPIQAMATTACELATTGYVNSTSGLHAVRSMMRFYQLQGRSGCADTLIGAETLPTMVVQIDLPTPTLTLTPPASKTPTPESLVLATATPQQIILPTDAAATGYEILPVTTLCSAEQSGLIQVFVYALNGTTGLPGQRIQVAWDDGESTFVTGLVPERGAGYADFEMEAGLSYSVEMPGLSDRLSTPLQAVPCTDATTGERAITTYRVIFRSLY